ncbi:agamous-like MADS-box protein AGL80 [Spinacia oleracea]|uniref:Agamous-like MADS-box protein AGL80 n=1 Tax=Spinacia oleracea TaxID=3562 RepID=A0A9R0ICK6_SPIOL|nr:agamous-like MADS-box protein AGL80 [Spinacia oleracea]
MPRLPRKKVKLSYIVNASERNASFKKRKVSLLKKLQEITTLCDVEGCAIIYYPHEIEPVIYPNDQSKVLSVISDFKRLPNDYQTKYMFNQERFLADKLSRANDQLKRLTANERDRNIEKFMHECLVDKTKSFENLTIRDLTDLHKLLGLQSIYIDRRIQKFERGEVSLPPTWNPTQVAPVGKSNVYSPNYNFGNYSNKDFNPNECVQWYIDMECMINNLPNEGIGSSSGSNSSVDPKI